MTFWSLRQEKFCRDLNPVGLFGDTAAPLWDEGMADECGINDFCSTDGFPSHSRVSPLRRASPRSIQGAEFFPLGSVSVFGVRSTELSRISARYLSLSAGRGIHTLSSGFLRSGVSQHAGPCQSSPRLAPLCRLGATPHCNRPPAVRRRGVRRRVGSHCLRFSPSCFSS